MARPKVSVDPAPSLEQQPSDAPTVEPPSEEPVDLDPEVETGLRRTARAWADAKSKTEDDCRKAAARHPSFSPDTEMSEGEFDWHFQF